MRSRYTAFTKADMDYINKTMKPPISEKFNADETRAWTLANKWLRLEIIKSSSAGNKGYVEFKAHFSRQDKPDLIHENSEFRRDNEQWFYINGEGPKMRSSVTDIKTANIRSTP
jgi:SEC-C motif-containing protein